MAITTASIGRDRYATQIEASGHLLTADEPAKLGGANAGPAPYDLLLASLGACTAITLRMYADRKQWPLDSLEVSLRLTGGAEDRRIVRMITPKGLNAEQAARLAEIAERTPVTLTLKAGVGIDTSFA
ncbi:MAG: OsmC family protein [Pseudomonadota bacterium]